LCYFWKLSVVASQNGVKPTNKIAADYMSFRNKSPVETFSTYETQNENKSLFEVKQKSFWSDNSTFNS